MIMEKMNLPSRFRVYAPLICLFALLVFLMPRSPKFNFDYRKGSPWMYETLVAQFDFPILKTESQLLADLEKAGTSVIPYYKQDPKYSVASKAMLSSVDFGQWQNARQAVSSALLSIYAKGLVSLPTSQEQQDLLANPEGLIYVQKDRRAEKVPLSEVYSVTKAESFVKTSVSLACPSCNVDSLYSAAGLNSLLIPDLIFDEKITEILHDQSVDYVATTLGVIRAGQVIVTQGEMVTAELEQILDSYKAEYDASIGYDGPQALLWVGNAILAFSMVLVLFLSILYCNEKIFNQYNKYLYLLMVFSLSAVGASVISRTDSTLFYMVPFTLLALFLLAFFKKRVVFTVYIISLLPILLFAPNGVEIFVMYLVAGIVGMLVFGYFNKGWLQFVTALIVFAVMVLVWAAFRMAFGGLDGFTEFYQILYMGLGALMTVAGYPLIYLFEKLFGLVSTSKLVELSDTSNSLLRLLADKAPGTFQHSLQVMNLADAVARSVDANVPLVRAAALYHDVGKLANPQCFTENETPGVKYHANLSPKESAQDIIRHVSDGMTLAAKHNIPDVIKKFILTHHGTTLVAFFYSKYVSEGGSPDDIASFRYDGEKPSTKEHVILMMCDAVEAASRSLKDYSPQSVSELVDRIVDGKCDDGQLADSDVTLRELTIIKEEIKSYLLQMYHSRVAYPKRIPIPKEVR